MIILDDPTESVKPVQISGRGQFGFLHEAVILSVAVFEA
jgi:hypothetical protein